MKLKSNFIIFLIICGALMSWNLYLLGEIHEKVIVLEESEVVLSTLSRKLDTLSQEHYKLESDKKKLIKDLDDILLLFKNTPKLNDVMLSNLKESGVNDPNEIIEDLMKKSKLIPHKGVLGGTIFISKAWLLTDTYVLAEFEDGHILGYMVLKYEIENGEYNWEVLDSYLQE